MTNPLPDTGEWTFAATTDGLTEDTPIAVELDGTAVGLYTLDGAVHALEDLCPHADALLTEGFVDGEYVECPLHGALFHIRTGKCTRGPAQRDLQTYETRVVEQKIYLRKPPQKGTPS